MTGFGAAEVRAKGRRLQVEIKAVNGRRGLDVQIALPRELRSLEAEVRSLVQPAMTRGNLMVDVASRAEASAEASAFRIDPDRLRAAHREVEAAARAAGLKGEVPLEMLLRLPGVVRESQPEAEAAALQGPLLDAVTQALEAFQKARTREGAFLVKDLKARFTAIGRGARAVAARKKDHARLHREALLRRLKETGLDLPVDDERLAKELAFFADRSDISEELTRLAAHLQEAGRLLGSKTPIGRNLDFLLQEIGREVNTVGSKANDLEITRRVVAMKTELEKIREQAQNLE